MNEKEAKLLNGLALAYMGDAVYELHIREYLLSTGKTKPEQLHRQATHYVSAKAQAFLVDAMLEDDILTEEEQDYFKRGRNAKSYTKAKNTTIMTYKKSTGFEAVFGFLYLTHQIERSDVLANWCIEYIEEQK